MAVIGNTITAKDDLHYQLTQAGAIINDFNLDEIDAVIVGDNPGKQLKSAQQKSISRLTEARALVIMGVKPPVSFRPSGKGRLPFTAVMRIKWTEVQLTKVSDYFHFSEVIYSSHGGWVQCEGSWLALEGCFNAAHIIEATNGCLHVP